MYRFTISFTVVLILTANLSSEPLPKVKKERVRTPLGNYQLLQVPFEITWKLGPEMPLPVKGGVAGILNNHLIIVPGIGFREHDAVVQALDLKMMKWIRLPDVPKPPVYTTGVCARNSIMIFSGRGGSKPEVGNSVQRLRCVDGKWVWDELIQLPKQIWYGNSTCVDDRWLVVSGGDTGTGYTPEKVSREVWVFDMDNPDKGWETAGVYEHGVVWPIMGGVNGKVYIIGGATFDAAVRRQYDERLKQGLDPGPTGWTSENWVYSFDLNTRKWQQCSSVPHDIYSGVAHSYGRYILIFGGAAHSDYSNLDTYRPGKSTSMPDVWRGYNDVVFVYDTSRNKWSSLNRLVPYGTANPQVAISGDKIYFAGGEPGHGYNLNTEDVLQIGTIRKVKQ